MKSSKKAILGLALALSGVVAAEAALAGHRHHHRSRVHFGIHFGVPLGYAAWHYHPHFYYPAPLYYSAPVVVQQPPVYIEQSAPAPAPAQSYWYYCADSRAYYPYVKDCPAGWQRVAPQPGAN